MYNVNAKEAASAARIQKEADDLMQFDIEQGVTLHMLLALKMGADVNMNVANKGTALHVAAGKGDVDLVQELLCRQANVHARVEEGGQTPLHSASAQRNPEVVQLLLDAGAKVNAVDSDGMTPLYYAAGYADTVIMGILLGAGADINAISHSRATPLCAAVSQYPASPDHKKTGLKLNIELLAAQGVPWVGGGQQSRNPMSSVRNPSLPAEFVEQLGQEGYLAGMPMKHLSAKKKEKLGNLSPEKQPIMDAVQLLEAAQNPVKDRKITPKDVNRIYAVYLAAGRQGHGFPLPDGFAGGARGPEAAAVYEGLQKAAQKMKKDFPGICGGPALQQIRQAGLEMVKKDESGASVHGALLGVAALLIAQVKQPSDKKGVQWKNPDRLPALNKDVLGMIAYYVGAMSGSSHVARAAQRGIEEMHDRHFNEGHKHKTPMSILKSTIYSSKEHDLMRAELECGSAPDSGGFRERVGGGAKERVVRPGIMETRL